MARTTPVRKAWRSLAWLGAIIILLSGINLLGTIFSNAGWVPKLALDLEGGTQIILAPRLESGQTVTPDQLNQAVSIIRQRIDASGVSESEINTQGASNIVVSIPGVPDDETIARIEASAKLEFRPVIFTDVWTPETVQNTPSATPEPGAEAETTEEGGETPDPLATEPAFPSPTASPTDASDANWVTPELFEEYQNIDCSILDELGTNVAPAGEPLITCQPFPDGSAYKFILGPVEVSGERISDARNGQVPNSSGVSTGEWGVFITFDGEGTEQFADVTRRLFSFPDTDPRNRFAIVLDGRVISAPTTQAVITDGKPVISGSFDQDSSRTLADQLKFGALPIGFEMQSRDTISATLGTSQLQSGLLAGLIGLALVVVYSIFQYRGLAAVTIGSLAIAALLTYLVLCLMSWRLGYRLSLAGVAGIIVAIGITADSFIVYFERIRDELRDGRTLEGAVEAGWKRAIRTILASDGVNFLAAATLIVLAVGNVRGFAVTLGITTIIDLVVVTLFTHPMLQLLARTRFFGDGHPWSGLDPRALGAIYRGRAQFRTAGAAVPAAKRQSSSGEAARRQTIAERKAAAAAAEGETAGKQGGQS